LPQPRKQAVPTLPQEVIPGQALRAERTRREQCPWALAEPQQEVRLQTGPTRPATRDWWVRVEPLRAAHSLRRIRGPRKETEPKQPEALEALVLL